MEYQVVDSSEKVTINDELCNKPYNESLIHQVVVAFRATGRAGTKAQLTRGEVSGTTAKKWRQKGTGNARVGNGKVNIWRSGGRAFAARPRSFAQKVNKKMYKGAMQSIVAELIRQERLTIVDNIALEKPKTKALAEKLQQWVAPEALILAEDFDMNLWLSARNIPNVHVQLAKEVDPVSLVRAPQVVITKKALALLQERLA